MSPCRGRPHGSSHGQLFESRTSGPGLSHLRGTVAPSLVVGTVRSSMRGSFGPRRTLYARSAHGSARNTLLLCSNTAAPLEVVCLRTVFGGTRPQFAAQTRPKLGSGGPSLVWGREQPFRRSLGNCLAHLVMAWRAIEVLLRDWRGVGPRFARQHSAPGPFEFRSLSVLIVRAIALRGDY